MEEKKVNVEMENMINKQEDTQEVELAQDEMVSNSDVSMEQQQENNVIEESVQTPKKKSKNLLLVVLVAVVIIVAGYLGFDYYTDVITNKEMQELMNSLIITFTDEIPFVEYGQDFDTTQFIQKHTGDLTYYEELDTSVVGMKQLKYTVSVEDEKHGTISKDFFYTATVKDTQSPVIAFNEEKVTVEYGATFDVKLNVKEVTDPVDGNLEYTVQGDVDTSKAGDYVVTVKAEDKNGNQSEATYTVTVNEKKVATTNKGSSSSNQTNGNKKPTSGSSGGSKDDKKESNKNDSSTNNKDNSNKEEPKKEESKSEDTKVEVKEESKKEENTYTPGNSGMIFDTKEEARTWATDYVANNTDTIKGYLLYSTRDKYTISFKYR